MTSPNFAFLSAGTCSTLICVFYVDVLFSVLPLYQARLRLDAQVPLIFNSKNGKKWSRYSNFGVESVLKEQTHEFDDVIQFKIPRHDLIFKNSNSFIQVRAVLDSYQFQPVQAVLQISYPYKKVSVIL